MRIYHGDNMKRTYNPWSDQGVEAHLIMNLTDDVVRKAMKGEDQVQVEEQEEITAVHQITPAMAELIREANKGRLF